MTLYKVLNWKTYTKYVIVVVVVVMFFIDQFKLKYQSKF